MNNYVNNKWIYGLIWLAVIAVIVWIIAGTSESTSDDMQVNQQTYTVEPSVQQESASQQAQKTETGYYYVKAENEVVKVYWVDESGEHLHLETSIAYSLLSVEDQELLNEGVKLETDEELARFIENFDS